MNTSGISREMKVPFGKALACELALLSREGRIPSRVKPLLEEVYEKIARRDSVRSVGTSLEQLLQMVGGQQ